MSEVQNKYAEQLRDPLWQKKRAEILIRDKYTCVHCGDTRTTIHVHHMRGYVRDCAPWEYPSDQLQTLCEDCHGALHGCAFGSVIYLGGGEWEYDALCPWRGCRSNEIIKTDNKRTGCDFCVTCGRDIDFYAATIKAAHV